MHRGKRKNIQLGKQLDRLDRSVDLPQAERISEHERLMREARRLHQEMQADREQLAAAQMVVSVVTCRVEMRYGDDVDLDNERTWEPALQRLSGLDTRRSQAVRPLVPA